MAMWNDQTNHQVLTGHRKAALLATVSGAVLLIAGQPASAQTQTTSPTSDTAASAADAADAPATPTPGVTTVESTAALADTSADSSDGGQSDIVVTGSLIARPDYKANSPIVSVTQEAFQATGQVTVERALSQLPQFSGGFGQSNTSSTGTGLNGGQSYATLRGLGSKRALLLLDGKRLQPSNPDGSVDLNTIPEALIGNVEIITGGASTTYGSDATAGVINFRLRRDFKGLTVNGQYGITNYGDGQTYRLNGTVGGKFAEDRGSIVLSLDYSGRTRAKRRERPWYSDELNVSGNAASAIGSAQFATSNSPRLATLNTLLTRYGAGTLVPTGSAGATFYNGQIGFNRDGTLFTANGAPALNYKEPPSDDFYLVDSGTASYGPAKQLKFNFLGGDVQTDLSRWTAFGRGEYEIFEGVNAFGQFSYVDYGQTAIVNTTLSNNIYLQNVPYNNPFLPADFRTLLASRPNPTADFQFHKAFNAVGNREQTYDYNVYQFMAGLDGKLGIGDLTWEVYGSTSKARFENGQSGGLSLTRLNQLVYAADGGRSICDGGLNLFGNFPISDSCANYIKRDTLNTTELRQRIVEGRMQGGIFDLPAGTVRFALGADYRKNSFAYDSDDGLNQPDGTSDIVGFTVLRDSAGSVNVKEVYGELFIPILRDKPFFQEFNLDLGYRYSDYNSIGSAHTYKVDAEWTVVDGVRFRGGYNRAIRAPSVGELFAPISTGSVSIGNPGANAITGDPCASNSSYLAGANAAQVRALCLAQGLTAAQVGAITSTAQVFPLTGGNPDLDEETAETYSAGVVLSSPFEAPLAKNIQLSIDYYKIDIKDAVGVLSVQQSVQYCFNVGGNNPSYDINNYYCSLLSRAPQGQFAPPTSQPLLNLGTFSVSGIDVGLDWRFNLEDIGFGENAGRITFHSVVSWLDKFKVQQLPGGPTYDYAGTIGFSIESNAGLTHPEFKANTSIYYTREEGSIGLTWRFIDKMKNSASVTSATPPKGIKAYNTFDLNANVVLPWETQLKFGVTNLFNKAPPSYSDIPETYDSSTYDVVGRYFFTSITKKF